MPTQQSTRPVEGRKRKALWFLEDVHSRGRKGQKAES